MTLRELFDTDFTEMEMRGLIKRLPELLNGKGSAVTYFTYLLRRKSRELEERREYYAEESVADRGGWYPKEPCSVQDLADYEYWNNLG